MPGTRNIVPGTYVGGYPYLHDASATNNLHVSNASRTTHPETHLETQNTATTHLQTNDTATPQQKTTTQGHAARTMCLCINSYNSAEQMTCVEETIALPLTARRCSEETFFFLVLVAVRFAWWTMMAELCFSVDDFILDFFINTTADTASEYDSYGHRRCLTAAVSCPYYSCRHHAKPVGLVLPRVCSRIRAKTASI